MGLIRFALALSVVFWHIRGAPFHLMNAAVAVTLFFIVSGFYMAMVINEKYARDDGQPWIRVFYAARFWRLYPAYFAMLAVMVLWYTMTSSPNPFTSRLPMPLFEQASLALINLGVIGQDLHQAIVQAIAQNSGPSVLWTLRDLLGANYFQDSVMMVGQAWSLSLELLFYLLAPFIVRSARRTALCLAAALLMRFALVGILHWRSGIWGYWFFPGALCMFLLGSGAYHLREMLPRAESHAIIGWFALTIFSAWFVILSVVNGVLMAPPGDGSIDKPKFWVLYVAFAVSVPFIFEATRQSRFDREIGELSYPLYLVHGLVVGLVYYRWAGPQGVVPDALATATLSVFAAYAMRQLVEVPTERYRQKMLARALSAGSRKAAMLTAK
jgi:peptidoglycan/LPS O-acetylase OafA/YrhL